MQIAERLKSLSLVDMRTEGGRKVWTGLMLGCLSQQVPIEVPLKPQELNGVEHWHIRKILESGRGERALQPQDVRDLQAWRRWRDAVVDAEIRNTNTLHGLLMLAKKLNGQQREQVEKHARCYFGNEVMELLNGNFSLYYLARDWCKEYSRCPPEWREPRRRKDKGK